MREGLREGGEEMAIIDEVLSSITGDSRVREVRACVNWTAVLSSRLGLASTMKDPGGGHHCHGVVRDVGALHEKSGRELAEWVNSRVLLEASIGMAALNSLLEIDESRCSELNASELLAKRGEGKRVAIVGHFPFIPKLREVARELWVIEKRTIPGDLPEDAAEEFLPRAHVVAITGTAFINHTIDRLLELAQNSFRVILGPSTPLSPVLLEHGVDAISGTLVVESDLVLRYISQGATFQQVKGVRLLTMVR